MSVDIAVAIARSVSEWETLHGPIAAARFVRSLVDDARRAIDLDQPADVTADITHRTLLAVVSLDRDTIEWPELVDCRWALQMVRVHAGSPSASAELAAALDALAARLDRTIDDRAVVTSLDLDHT